MTKTNLSDGCADAVCPTHGFILRVIVGALVLCNQCKRWITAGASEKLRRRRDCDRDRKRKQRAEARSAREGLNPVTL
jgi:hypothetical protein